MSKKLLYGLIGLSLGTIGIQRGLNNQLENSINNYQESQMDLSSSLDKSKPRGIMCAYEVALLRPNPIATRPISCRVTTKGGTKYDFNFEDEITLANRRNSPLNGSNSESLGLKIEPDKEGNVYPMPFICFDNEKRYHSEVCPNNPKLMFE